MKNLSKNRNYRPPILHNDWSMGDEKLFYKWKPNNVAYCPYLLYDVDKHITSSMVYSITIYFHLQCVPIYQRARKIIPNTDFWNLLFFIHVYRTYGHEFAGWMTWTECMGIASLVCFPIGLVAVWVHMVSETPCIYTTLSQCRCHVLWYASVPSPAAIAGAVECERKECAVTEIVPWETFRASDIVTCGAYFAFRWTSEHEAVGWFLAMFAEKAVFPRVGSEKCGHFLCRR